MKSLTAFASLTLAVACTYMNVDIAHAAPANATSVQLPPIDSRNANYASERAPLKATPFVKLPVGAIRPDGWLKHVLELQRDGLSGHLGEISKWLIRDDNAWLNKSGKGQYGWEELPYWLKGYVRIAYVLNDPRMIAESKVWIEGTLASQRDDGDFGPIVEKNGGKRDLWAQMLMLNTLQSYYEATNDERVLPFMTRYFKWQATIPDDRFLRDYWENSRGGDNLQSVYWVYNRTGDKDLLDVATKIDRCTANWRQAAKGHLPNWHGVNVAQCFREPAEYALQSGKASDTAAATANQNLMRQLYGQVPGGMFGADENARKGFADPRQGTETCAMVEQLGSNEMMLQMTGNALWADNTEDVAFNTYSAAFTPDYRALRYLTAPNMAVSDSKNHAPGIQNNGPFLMMNPFSSRCCQHNHTSGWPNYLETTWMATADDGLAAQLYSATSVTAKVGKDGAPVTVTSETHYPFEETVRLTLRADKPTDFPLYLRIPHWAEGATIAVNGKPVDGDVKPGQYARLAGTWSDGDKVEVHLPMKLSVRRWERNKNSASVNYGPLTFSLKIDEKYEQKDSKATAIGDSGWQPNADPAKWPSFEIYPNSPWNYGLLLDADPTKSFEVVRKDWPKNDDPFTNDTAPILLKAKGKKIDAWKLDKYELVDLVPQSPVKTDAPTEDITLVPMGGARLRISAFPVIAQ